MASRVRQFASDNYAGICPEAWEAMAQANRGHVISYGDDEWTAKASDMIREVFETKCEVFFVFNGTSANSLALSHLCQSYHSVLCSEVGHIETDECGAPEFFSNGTKILLLPAQNGKVEPAAIEQAVNRRTDIHYPKPRVMSIAQSTELGTVYSVSELQAIAEMTRRLGLHLHMDGARLANAVASLGAKPRQITWETGVDVLSFGATKNGGPVGEAVVFFNLKLAEEFEYRCKQAGQLASKMRFLSAPWVGMLSEGAWLKHARHSNSMAALLEKAIRDLPGVKLLFPRQANAVFVQLPEPVIQQMHEKGWRFYTFIGKGGCRLMCSWDTTEEDVKDFAKDLAAVLRR
ncbi:MAG: threonine aldolase family protein [Bacillota bacterium]